MSLLHRHPRALAATLALTTTLGVTGLLTAFGAPAHSAPATPAASYPMLARTGPFTTGAYRAEYATNITGEHFSSVAAGNFFGTGTELVAGGPDGILRFFDLAGHQVWTFDTGKGAIQASPAVVDDDHDGHPDVAVANTRGDVWIVSPFRHRGLFHVVTGDGVHQPGNFATPEVTDVNGDGVLDVVETSWDHHIHVWSTHYDAAKNRFDELPGFPVFLQDTAWSSPDVVDLFHNGKKEIVFGYDCDGVPGQKCAGHPGGYVGVLSSAGKELPGWPKFIPGQTVWSTPAIADIDGDGKPDIVVGTGGMPAPHMPGGQFEYAFHSNGSAVKGWPVHLPVVTGISSPAIGNLTGTGPDIATVATDGRLYVLNGAGHVLATTCVSDNLGNCPHSLHTSVVIADVDGDGHQEVVVGGEQWLDVYRLEGSSLVLVHRGWPGNDFTPHPFSAAPAVVADGNDTLLVEATDRSFPNKTWGMAIYVWHTGHKLGRADWPEFKHDFARTGT